MLENLKEYIKNSFKDGFAVPLFKDDGKPSATFTFAYTSFIVAILAELYFILNGDYLASTATAIVFWALAVVFYRLRKLDHVKFDIDDKTIELDGEDDDEK